MRKGICIPKLNMTLKAVVRYIVPTGAHCQEWDVAGYHDEEDVVDSTTVKVDFSRWHVTCAITANAHDMARAADAIADFYSVKTATTIRKKDLEALIAAKKKLNRFFPPHDLHFKLDQYGDNLVVWFSDTAKGDLAPKLERITSLLRLLPEGTYGVAIAAGWPVGHYEDAPEHFDALAPLCDEEKLIKSYQEFYTYDLLSAAVPYTGGGAELPAELLVEPDLTEPHAPRVKVAGYQGSIGRIDKCGLKKLDLSGLAESVATSAWMDLREIERSY